MSHYANYVKELKDSTVVEDEYGFYQYKLCPQHLFIEELYVDSRYRGFREAKRYIREMAKIAKDNDYTYLMGAIAITNKNPLKLLSLYLRNNCKLHSTDRNYIYLTINIEDAEALEA